MCTPRHASRSLAFLRGALILLIVPLVGCTLGAAKRTAATPPPPKPVAVLPPAPDPPLSIPQTAVTLPPPQPLNPDAIPLMPVAQAPVPEKTEAPPAAHTARRTAAGPPKPEPESDAEAPAAPAPAVQEQTPSIQPILSGDELKRIQGAIEARKHEIEERLGRAKHLSSHDKSQVERIHSFLAQCTQAEQRGDYPQADALSERAVVLARELPGE
ncbi:MAG: hypothetical protein ABSF54_25385 [Bryobacteraceae bacterium]|jgi:hypothetical protein